MGFIKNILTKLYGVRMALSKASGIGINKLSDTSGKTPPVSLYSLTARTTAGKLISLASFAGKKLLFVNLASQCGYTPQYKDLQKLQDQYSGKLVVLGFPSNDFGGQEPGSDSEISTFCEVNYGVRFQLFTKAAVSGNNKQLVYDWLTDPEKNGWNSQEPTWNFCKYLIDENGRLLNFYSSSVGPLSSAITTRL